jgi:hypothetical protein
MPRVKSYLHEAYGLAQNPFPATAIARWGSADERENGSLFNSDVSPREYEEAVDKFIVGPIDSGSKFHFLWSLGEGEEARGFGKTVLLRHLSRAINHDLGRTLLESHGFDPEEVRNTPVLATMGTFNKTDVTSLSAVCLEQVGNLAQVDPITGLSPLMVLRKYFVESLEPVIGPTDEEAEAEAIRKQIKDTDLSLAGKTLGAPDRRFVDFFANGNWPGLVAFVRQADQKSGFDLLSTSFVVAKATGIKKIFLFIDEVEAFASADTPKKRRSMEVERFRDIAIETQPFGDMASYVLTMHPAAARSIDEFWSLARLPKIDHLLRQNQRITVILNPITDTADVEKLLTSYLKTFRQSDSDVQPIHPFDRSALHVLLEHSGGRPGPILKFAHELIEEGARNRWNRIGESEARQIAEEDRQVPELPTRTRRRGIGAIE